MRTPDLMTLFSLNEAQKIFIEPLSLLTGFLNGKSVLYPKLAYTLRTPLYAVDVHMDVSSTHYGCSRRPSFWNFARNLGNSKVISDGEMQ